MPPRTPEEIRASIERNRQDLGDSLEKLRDEVEQLTDWRAQLRRQQEQLTMFAFGAGFFLGGGIAGINGILFGRRRRKRVRS
jgi:hypothetical protein